MMNLFKSAARRKPVMIVVVALAIIFLTVLYLLLHTPRWYRMPVVMSEKRQSVRNNLVSAEQAFTESLRSGEQFIYHIYEDNLNRWIAMRHEIYPLIDEITPSVLTDPLVLFEDGLLTIAGRYRIAGSSVVISITIEPDFREHEMVLIARSIHCGLLSLPLSMKWGLDRTISYEEGKLWPGSPAVSGNLIAGLRVSAEAWWKNGGVAYEVQAISIAHNQLDLTIMPLGRHADRTLNRHLSSDP